MVCVGEFGEFDEFGWVRPAPHLAAKCASMPATIRARAFAEWAARANANPERGLLPRQEANEWLRGLVRPFLDLPPALRGIGFDARDEEVVGVAEAAAKAFIQFERMGYGVEGMIRRAAEEYGLDKAVFKGMEPPAVVARLKDELFWRRLLRRFIGRGHERALREVGAVSRKAGLYVSHEGLSRRKSQKHRNAALLKTLAAVNELGQEFTLEELSAVGTSNPEIRRAELMVRIRGFEEIAKLKGHVGEFFTLTCPSAYHKMHHYGKPNDKFNGSTPRDAVAYLNKVWQRVRAELGNLGIKVYGFRVAEPHHDGTPHWHGLLFMEKEHRLTFRRVLAKHGCREDREELGLRYFASKKEAMAEARQIRARLLAENGSAPTLQAIAAGLKVEADFWGSKYFKFWKQSKAAARVDFESINWARGSAAGYIAKYIAKNIDGRNNYGDSVGVDFESEELLDAATTAERVDAWASIHGTRQFQQIGGPPVTVWRELRRMVPTDDDSVLMLAQRAADRGDWAAFVALMGGEAAKRADHPLALYKEQDEAAVNKYGEPAAPYTMGVYQRDTGEVRISRVHTWEVYRIGGKAAAWTRVNNCTKIENRAKTPEIRGKMSEKEKKILRIKEWLIYKKGVSAAQLGSVEITPELEAEFDLDEAAAVQAARRAMSPEAIESEVKQAAARAAAAEKQAVPARKLREYIAVLDKAARPIESGLTPAAPMPDFSALKTKNKPRRYTPPVYDTVESAIVKAQAVRKQTAEFNRKFD